MQGKLLPNFAVANFWKIFEKLLFDTICSHLNENGLLSQHQSGFRPGDSATNQLLAITHNICKAFEEVPSKEIRAVFLDLLKAFDRVWHDCLLYKLEVNGISGNIIQLIKNFLTDRKKRVVLKGKVQNGNRFLQEYLKDQSLVHCSFYNT